MSLVVLVLGWMGRRVLERGESYVFLKEEKKFILFF